MTWLQRLYETYERCVDRQPDGGEELMPICHTRQRAHIEVVLDGRGEFRRALVVPRDDAETLMPATEASAGRSGSKPLHHPLCDKLQYVAGDFVAFHGTVTSGFAGEPDMPYKGYLSSLQDWAASPSTHPKVEAILAYVQHSRLIGDLVREGVLHLDTNGRLLSHWEGEKAQEPPVFAALGAISQHDCLVRWRVEEAGDPVSATWDDTSLIQSWIGYYQGRQTAKGFCMVTGEDVPLALQHPKRLRNAGDQAKLISSNDTSGYTFRGRFIDAEEAAGVGFEVTQKAHNALRWLIARQSYRDGDQVFVAWSPGGARLPDVPVSTLSFLSDDEEEGPADTAEAFALRLRRKIAGYRSEIDEREDVVVMGLDSATPGRISITYYRTLLGSEFLDRLERWHDRFAWYQNMGGKNGRFVGAAAPRLIAEAAFGSRLDEKLRRSTVERLMPCIIESAPVPRDIVHSTVRRACNRAAVDNWEWEKTLGIACSLFKGYYQERSYRMALETDRTTRDYLYGRLLAVADNIEGYVLKNILQEDRSTTAERLMHRFADHPFSTWRTIELSLRPYMGRLRSAQPGFLVRRESLLQEIKDMFSREDFMDDRPLSGEFLLSFDVQRKSLFSRSSSANGNPADPMADPTGDPSSH
jgi:CRISPR-associated protein Csd1